MKSMTCLELGGACSEVFQAQTFEEIAQLSQQHGQQMAQQSDGPHLEAMQEMMTLMNQGGFDAWFAQKQGIFESR
jgi:hypothetical protein